MAEGTEAQCQLCEFLSVVKAKPERKVRMSEAKFIAKVKGKRSEAKHKLNVEREQVYPVNLTQGCKYTSVRPTLNVYILPTSGKSDQNQAKPVSCERTLTSTQCSSLRGKPALNVYILPTTNKFSSHQVPKVPGQVEQQQCWPGVVGLKSFRYPGVQEQSASFGKQVYLVNLNNILYT